MCVCVCVFFFFNISTLSLTAQMEMRLMNMHAIPKLSVLKLAVATPSHLAPRLSFSVSASFSGVHSVRYPRYGESLALSHESTSRMIFTKNIQCEDESFYDIVQRSKDRLKITVCLCVYVCVCVCVCAHA